MARQRVGRYSQVARILRILKILQSHPSGVSITEIHEQIRDTFPVGRRSIYRDLEALAASGFPTVSVKSGERVTWRLTAI